MSTQALPSIDTTEDVFNVLETEITAPAEYLAPSFFEGIDVFAPDSRGRKREFDPYGLFLAHLWQTQLDETNAERSQVENAIKLCKDGGLGYVPVRDRQMAKAHVFLSLCLRLVIAITNYERGSDPNSPNLAL